MAAQFELTTTDLASALSPPGCPTTVRTYADAGLIESMRLPNGMRLFRRSAIEKVNRLRAQRIKSRGGDRTTKAAPI
jgi:hypothetical protein